MRKITKSLRCSRICVFVLCQSLVLAG
ncbi:MAG: hypothetical protein H6Q05_4572, partial [Acidobacteria bacterium]|nr:hypothetical protein [Acidobacteriota bacterium]